MKHANQSPKWPLKFPWTCRHRDIARQGYLCLNPPRKRFSGHKKVHCIFSGKVYQRQNNQWPFKFNLRDFFSQITIKSDLRWQSKKTKYLLLNTFIYCLLFLFILLKVFIKNDKRKPILAILLYLFVIFLNTILYCRLSFLFFFFFFDL